MANPLLDLASELVEAVEAAGLQARTFADPDRGPGVVVKPPVLAWTNITATGCGRMPYADVTVELVVVGAGYAPEQLEVWSEDAWTASQAVPDGWRVTGLTADDSGDSPTYTITVER